MRQRSVGWRSENHTIYRFSYQDNTIGLQRVTSWRQKQGRGFFVIVIQVIDANLAILPRSVYAVEICCGNMQTFAIWMRSLNMTTK